MRPVTETGSFNIEAKKGVVIITMSTFNGVTIRVELDEADADSVIIALTKATIHAFDL